MFLESLWIGLAIAAPVGPIGLLVIQRTLQRGALVGLATGLGAALADGLYGAVGAFGVSWIIEALSGARVPLALGGGAFLLWLAWRIAHTPPTGGFDLPSAITAATLDLIAGSGGVAQTGGAGLGRGQRSGERESEGWAEQRATAHARIPVVGRPPEEDSIARQHGAARADPD